MSMRAARSLALRLGSALYCCALWGCGETGAGPSEQAAADAGLDVTVQEAGPADAEAGGATDALDEDVELVECPDERELGEPQPACGWSGVRSFPVSVWGSSSTGIYAGGVGGALYHFDGDAWRNLEIGTTGPITSLWGSGPDDVFAVSNRTIHHFDGVSWSRTEPGLEMMGTIWGSSPCDVFAGGARGTIVHYDGAGWSLMDTGVEYAISGLWGTGPADVWAIANKDVYTDTGPWHQGRVLHFDGTSWSVEAEFPDASAMGIWGSGPDDIYIAGEARDEWGRWSSLIHYDGVQWEPVELDSSLDKPLYAVWGRSWRDVYAAGERGVLLHYDGSQWSKIDLGTPHAQVYSIGGDDQHVYLSSLHGILAFDGTKVFTAFEWESASSSIKDLWGSGPEDIFAVGYDQKGARGLVMHFDGTMWGRMEVPPGEPGVQPWGFVSVAGSGPDNVLAVGSDGGIYKYDGSTWARLPSSPDSGVAAIWSGGPDNTLAVGGGVLSHYDGESWQTEMEWASKKLRMIWASSQDAIFISTLDGALLHFDGMNWAEYQTETPGEIRSISGSAADNVFALQYDAVLHFDGSMWTRTELPNREHNTYRDLFVVAPEVVYVAGDGHAVARFDGSSWEMEIVTGFHTSVWGSGPANVYTAAPDMSLYRYGCR